MYTPRHATAGVFFCTVGLLLAASRPCSGANRFFFEPTTVTVGSVDQTAKLHCENDVELVGFSLALDYDDAMIDVTAIETTPVTAAANAPVPAMGFFAGKVEDGRIVWGVIVDFFAQNLMPISTGQAILEIRFDVLATVSTATPLTFRDVDLPERLSELTIMTGILSRPVQGVTTEDGTITIVPVPAPSDLLLAGSSASSIRIAWCDNSDGETRFEVERMGPEDADFVEIASLPANASGFTDTDVEPGVLYEYRVRAGKEIHTSDYSDILAEITRPFELLKAKGKLGKRGWVLKLARLTFNPENMFYDGDASEIRVTVNGLEFFSPETILKQKIKVKRKTGQTVAIVLKDFKKNVIVLNFKKSVAKIVLKNLSPDHFDPTGGVELELAFDVLRAQINLPTQLVGKKLNKLLFTPTAAGEFQPLAESNPCPDL